MRGKAGYGSEAEIELKALLRDVELGEAEYSVIHRLRREPVGVIPGLSRKRQLRNSLQAGPGARAVLRRAVRELGKRSVIKNVKRTMVGEYSRKLSVKLHAGQMRLIRTGVQQGGPTGYSLRRMLVDHKGKRKPGEHTTIQTDRVILVRGPIEETETVRRIYRVFVKGRAEGLRNR
ncbi:hypothetical protein [Paraburkholderia xenovorans]|uniref:hypothetical protein n=1 Tax=Paraburkholderia xenovorans TaxID=36873 RepID=UPI0038BE0D44